MVIPDQRRTDLARSARAELARRSLYWFVRYSFTITNPGVPFEDSPHIKAVCDHVQRLLEDWGRARSDPAFVQVCRDLLINLPPRCLKSTLVSVCATAWAWIHWPAMKIGCLSVNPRVSYRDALGVRKLIGSDWYRESFSPTWVLRDDQQAISNFANTSGGSRIARGFDSNVVGEGFDWIIVDDPHDPRDTADAVQKVVDGWDVAVGSRQSDYRTSIRAGIMQAVTEGDFSEHVRGQGWGWLCLPMEFEPSRVVESPFGWRDWRTVEGECLHPARFPPHVLDQLKIERGSYAYAAQFQQRPAPLAGGIIQKAWFKRFTMADLPSKLDWTTISVDATFGSVAEGADNVGLLVVAGAGPMRYVLCDASRRMSFLDSVAAIRALMVQFPEVRRVLIEKAAAGGPITEMLRREINSGGLQAVAIEEINPRLHGSKTDRVVASLPQLESGMVALLDGAPWVEAFVGEHGLFPNGQHDDRVDALTQLLIRYNGTDVRAQWKAAAKGMAALMRR
jgi:predicted phage terminase large subunit-like protein